MHMPQALMYRADDSSDRIDVALYPYRTGDELSWFN